MTKYEELRCGRCRNRRSKVKSKQGMYCEKMLKSDSDSCPKFNFDK